MTTPFLESLKLNCHLSDDTVRLLIEEEMTQFPHFKGCTRESLKEIGLKTGPANAIATHIQALTAEATPVSPDSLRNLDSETLNLRLVTESDEERFRKLASKFNGGDTTVTTDLEKFAARIVQDPDKKINIDETFLMLKYPGDLDKIWIGKDGVSRLIVPAAKLNDSYIYLYFRNGKHLQNGIDPNTGINWQSLGDEKLNLLWFAYDQGITGQKDDDTIFEEFKMETKSYSVAKLQYDWGDFYFIKYVKIAVSDLKRLKTEEKIEVGYGHQFSIKSKEQALYDLIIVSFSSEEILRYCNFGGDDFKRVVENITAGGPLAVVTNQLISSLTNLGLIKDFLQILIRERPRKRDHIINVGLLFGFNL